MEITEAILRVNIFRNTLCLNIIQGTSEEGYTELVEALSVVVKAAEFNRASAVLDAALKGKKHG